MAIDTDEMVVALSGVPIEEMFARGGESVFRALETEMLARALARTEPTVIACGGGVVLDPRNVEMLAENAHTVYLEVSANEVRARIEDVSSRPLLATIGATGGIIEMMDRRKPLYAQAADMSIDTDGHTLQEVCDGIEKALREGEHGILHP
jgi:shikimate kinase